MRQFFLFGSLVMVLAIACQEGPQNLPILGNKVIEGQDTIYHSIPDFTFVNQDSQLVTNATFEDKIYVVDFFFTACPTICPKLKQQMLRLYDLYKEEDRLLLLSHTIDTKRDTVAHLKAYAENLGVESSKWHFVTGDKDEIYEIADDYFSVALEDADAPGGFDHSGRLIVVDENRHIRSFCDGTDPKAVDAMMKDLDFLLTQKLQ